MKKIFFSCILLFAFACSKDDSQNGEQDDIASTDKWISEIVEYKPAPGQFINTSLGTPEGVKRIVGGLGSEISLGGYGGYIIFKFNHKVKNKEGVDFVIFGNSFKTSSEPGIVMVQANGKWYELKGADYDNAVRDYEITYTKPEHDADDVAWTDNKGESGAIEKLSAHPQAYFPNFLNATTLTFTGSKIETEAYVDDKFEWVLKPLGSGYADNFSSDYNEIVGGDKETKGSNKFDISKAIDDKGNSVSLLEIDAIKVYNCVNFQAGPLGEYSTEIRGAISLSVQ